MSKKKNKPMEDERYDDHIITEKLYRKHKSRHRDKTRRQQRLRKLKYKEDGGHRG